MYLPWQVTFSARVDRNCQKQHVISARLDGIGQIFFTSRVILVWSFGRSWVGLSKDFCTNVWDWSQFQQGWGKLVKVLAGFVGLVNLSAVAGRNWWDVSAGICGIDQNFCSSRIRLVKLAAGLGEAGQTFLLEQAGLVKFSVDGNSIWQTYSKIWEW